MGTTQEPTQTLGYLEQRTRHRFLLLLNAELWIPSYSATYDVSLYTHGDTTKKSIARKEVEEEIAVCGVMINTLY